MARRESTVVIRTEPDSKLKPGRDEGKVFRLREMSATQAEDWAMRALLALTNAGAEIPDEAVNGGMAGLAVMGVQALAGLKYDAVKPLMDEMFTCVQIQPNPRDANVVRGLVEDDIEEVSTRLQLRKAVLELHVGFSLAGDPSMPGAATPDAPTASRITRTSPVQ